MRLKAAKWAIALAAAAWLAPASAQPLRDPVVVQLKQRGDAAIEAGHYQEALDAYTKALAIEPTPAIHYNRGRALQALGRNAEALAELELFASTAPASLKAAVPDLEGMIARTQQQVAEVQVSSPVAGASLHVAGKVLALPLERPLRLDPGSFDLQVTAAGYETWRGRVTLGSGDRREVSAALTKQDTHGTLLVHSTVTGTEVRVDGRLVGAAPSELRLTPGEHTVTLERAGYETASSRVVLGPRERRTLTLTLAQTTRFYERWWFWTAVGAAAATGAVVAIAVSTEGTPVKGDIPPGHVTAPLMRW